MKTMLLALTLTGTLAFAAPWVGAQTAPTVQRVTHSVAASTAVTIRPQPLPFCYYHPSAPICVMP